VPPNKDDDPISLSTDTNAPLARGKAINHFRETHDIYTSPRNNSLEMLPIHQFILRIFGSTNGCECLSEAGIYLRKVFLNILK
jgi:hypothetical protein